MKHTFFTSRKGLQTIALGTVSVIGAFAIGMETAGDVHPFGTSEAALQEVTVDGSILRGDANGNGMLDAQDASIVLQAADGLMTPSHDQVRRGDTDGDLQLTSRDALRILNAISSR